MAKYCPICRGAGVMVYRVSEPLTTMDYNPSETITPLKTKTYPCPECSNQVSFDKLRIVKIVNNIPMYNLEFAEVSRHIEKTMTAGIADKMHRMGLLHYTVKETGPDYHKVHEFSGAIGVVDKNSTKTYIETLEETRKKAVQDTIERVLNIIRWEFIGSYDSKEKIIREINRIS